MKQDETGKQGAEAGAVRRNRPEPVAGAGELANAAFRRAGFDDPALVLRWRDIVGLEVARFARPLKLVEGPGGGVLSLKAEPAAAVFLQHQSRILCERINTFLGREAVSRLRFVPGPVPPMPEAAPQIRRRAQPLPGDPVLGFSGPDGLQAALLNLARVRARPRPGN